MFKKLVLAAFVLVLLVGAFGLLRARAGAKPPKAAVQTATVVRDSVKVTIVETGTVDANRVVEVKSGVTGRLARLLVQEGDQVRQGDRIAFIDPQETTQRVNQDLANLQGAESGAERAKLEIAQRQLTNLAALKQAEARVAQLEAENRVQPRLVGAAVEQSKAALAIAQEQLRQLDESTQPNQRAATQSALVEAQANVDQARLEYDRRKDLFQKGYVAQREVEAGKQNLDVANARLQQARVSLDRLAAQLRSERARAVDAVRQAQADLARSQANTVTVQTKRQELESARADLQRARAALQDSAILSKGREQNLATVAQIRAALTESQRLLRETTVFAPITGVVVKRLLQEGELASGLSSFGSGTPIVRIEDRRRMRIKLDVNEIDVARMKLGMIAKINIDAIPERAYSGKVTKIAPSSKEAAATAADTVVKYEVEIEITDKDDKLRSGMSAKCTLDVVDKASALTIPTEFVVRDGSGAYVLVAGTGKPTKTSVRLGADAGLKVEILSGVAEGTKLVKPEFSGPKRKGAMQFGDGE